MVSLAELRSRLAGLADVPEDERLVRGMTLALAEGWVIRLPDGRAKERALFHLLEAAEAACEAVRTA